MSALWAARFGARAQQACTATSVLGRRRALLALPGVVGWGPAVLYSTRCRTRRRRRRRHLPRLHRPRPRCHPCLRRQLRPMSALWAARFGARAPQACTATSVLGRRRALLALPGVVGWGPAVLYSTRCRTRRPRRRRRHHPRLRPRLCRTRRRRPRRRRPRRPPSHRPLLHRLPLRRPCPRRPRRRRRRCPSKSEMATT